MGVGHAAHWLFGPDIRGADSKIDGKVVRNAGSAWRPGAITGSWDLRGAIVDGELASAPEPATDT